MSCDMKKNIAMCESDQIIEELVSLMVPNADPHSTEEAYNLGLEDAIEKIKEYSS